MKTWFLVIGLSLAASAAWAGDACTQAACDPGCNDPGCQQQAACDCKHCPRCGNKMACKIVCDVKEVKKTVWEVKCEPFCPPLPRLCGGCGCGDPACRGQCANQSPECCACADGKCGQCDPCAVENARKIVPPKCGCLRTKKTLEKKEVTCKVPTYKCVAVCPCCGHNDPSVCRSCEAAAEKAVEKAAPAAAPAPAPAPKSTMSAPLPPALTSLMN